MCDIYRHNNECGSANKDERTDPHTIKPTLLMERHFGELFLVGLVFLGIFNTDFYLVYVVRSLNFRHFSHP